MERWDAIVVGAGPAGCAAAYDLAAAGRSVLLLDRAEFPRHKACAGGLTSKTLRALRYSVASVTRATLSAIVVEKGAGHSTRLESRTLVCAMTVREELDEYCLRQTIARGAQFVRIGTIEAIEQDERGVTVRTDGADFAGRFLVGADGVHSRVRQLLYGPEPAWFWRGFALEAQVRPERGCSADLVFAFDAVRGGYGWIFPKHDHLNAGLYTATAGEKLDRGRLLGWIEGRFDKAAIEGMTGQYLGFGADRAPAAEGRVLLAGDAGGFADPLTGEGIYGAIASGQAAARAAETELQSGVPASRTFALATARLRDDLRLSASGAGWFHSNLDLGLRALTAPLLRRALLEAYANGTKIAGLARAVRQFAHAFRGSA